MNNELGTNIILFDKYEHEKLNDELYREVIIYEVDGKNQHAYMMAKIDEDGISGAYNEDEDAYYNPETEEVSDKIPEDVLDRLVDMAREQIESDYNKEKEKNEYEKI